MMPSNDAVVLESRLRLVKTSSRVLEVVSCGGAREVQFGSQGLYIMSGTV